MNTGAMEPVVMVPLGFLIVTVVALMICASILYAQENAKKHAKKTTDKPGSKAPNTN